MSTTLINGIIIPDNGSRNWGGDLANNWNIIDLNVGYMADVKNSVTTLENSVAENTANIQINASNISALQTSKQDVIEDLETIRAGASSGATAVQPSEISNKANDSEVVHKSGDETISGTKLFTVSPICANSNATNGFFIRNDAIVRNEVPSKFYHHAFRVYDKSNQILGEFCVEKSTSGYSLLNMNVRSETDDGTEISKGLFLVLANDGSNVFFRPSSNNEFGLGTANNKWKDIYVANATINTSDRNAKTSIKNIDDNILEAWDNVSLVSFKFKDAVEKKGDNARFHVGYIAQDIKEELAKYNIDACKYGLFCYNSWDAQEEKSHEEERICKNGTIETVKVIDTPGIEAGETYGLRYIECLVVECAYLRKKNKELENRISKLEKNLNA